ncbi:hypothetical protein IscW_ISCW001587, partial [Ixodes scapularis]
RSMNNSCNRTNPRHQTEARNKTRNREQCEHPHERTTTPRDNNQSMTLICIVDVERNPRSRGRHRKLFPATCVQRGVADSPAPRQHDDASVPKPAHQTHGRRTARRRREASRDERTAPSCASRTGKRLSVDSAAAAKKKLSRRRLRLVGLGVRPCNPFRLASKAAGAAASSEPLESNVVLADIERNVARQTPAVRGGRPRRLCQTGEEAGESRRTSLCGRRRRGEDGGRRAASQENRSRAT